MKKGYPETRHAH